MIYLDNSATTELSDFVKSEMISAMDCYGNPSSRHSLGLESRRLVEKARARVGAALGCRAEDIVFTSCGSEANNLAILGAIYSKKRNGGRIITSDSEHPSVENVMKSLEAQGFDVVRIPTRGGVFNMDAYRDALNGNVILVSVMMTNNETGAVYNVGEIFAEAKRVDPDIITHCDAVQGFLKREFSPRKIFADTVSVSAHKIHGPKGVGALYVSPETVKQKKLIPHLIGGGQENGFRSGTENVIGIVGFGAAAEEGAKSLLENIAKISALRDLCADMIAASGAKVNIPEGERAAHIVSVTLPRIKSETMLNYLSAKGFCISAGSACSSHSKHLSSALVGFGLNSSEADSTVRISLSEKNTEEEMIAFCEALSIGIKTLVRFKR